MELIDCHSHTAYSGHGSGTIAQAVARAKELGLAVYAQTEHLTLPEELDPQREDSMSPEVAVSYQQELRAEQAMLAGSACDLELVAGIEADWLPNRGPELQELCKPYDYVIGSIHFLDGLPIDNSDNLLLWDEQGVDKVWESYLNAMEQMITSDAPINCVGHPDLPKLFGWLPSFNLRDAFGDIAALVARRGLIVEVNTAGLRKKVGVQYPSVDILSLFAQAGVPCTVGCDAHKSADIAAGVEDAYRVMYEAGYRKVCAPTMRTSSQGECRYFEIK